MIKSNKVVCIYPIHFDGKFINKGEWCLSSDVVFKEGEWVVTVFVKNDDKDYYHEKPYIHIPLDVFKFCFKIVEEDPYDNK